MRNSDLVIRAYEPADKETLSSIWFQASLRVHAFLGEELLFEQKEMVENIFLEQAEIWVALSGGKIIGFIGLLDHFIGGLFVHPKAQGQGVGRKLVEHAFKLRGELELEVFAENQSAYRFYRKLGFVEISRRAEDDSGLPFENIRMRLA